MAIGLRFAGSADRDAQSTLMHFLRYFVSFKRNAPEPGATSPCIINREVLESCAGSVALALSLVMAGTGDLTTFKLLRGMCSA